MFMIWISVLICNIVLLFFKQETAYDMRISDWSSDVCSSDLASSKHAGTLIEAATKENIRRSVKTLQEATPILAKSVHEKTLKIVGGIYRLDTEIGRASCRESVCKYG